MAISNLAHATRSPPPFVTAMVFQLVATCLDIRAVWSLDHDPGDAWMTPEPHPLLAFADATTLARLRKSDELHGESALMVVIDGDNFECAWPPGKLSGSLARWAWRQTTPDEAYYDEARWAGAGEAGAIVRVRRKAFLVWQPASTASS